MSPSLSSESHRSNDEEEHYDSDVEFEMAEQEFETDTDGSDVYADDDLADEVEVISGDYEDYEDGEDLSDVSSADLELDNLISDDVAQILNR